MGYGGATGWKYSGKINWDKVSVEGGKVAPAGLYEGKAARLELKSSSTDKPMIEAKIELVGSDDDNCKEEGVGGFVFDNWVLTDEGAFRLKQFCLAAEISPPASIDYDDVSKFAEEALGLTFPVVIKRKTFDGRPRAQVDYYGATPPKDKKDESEGRRGRRGRRG